MLMIVLHHLRRLFLQTFDIVLRIGYLSSIRLDLQFNPD